MKTALLTAPDRDISLAALRRGMPEECHGWKLHFEINPAAWSSHRADAIIVRMTNAASGEYRDCISQMASLQGKLDSCPHVVFVLTPTAHEEAWQRCEDTVLDKLWEFQDPARVSCVKGSWQAVEKKLKWIERILALQHRNLALQGRARPKAHQGPRASPLDREEAVLQSTADLRVESGRLSAAAVADAYGISLSELAGWLGKTKQAMSKTPDAKSLQQELGYFERVARLRMALPEDRFSKWLRMPNAQLRKKSPLDLLASGSRQAVADLADDMLTGAPA